MRTPPTEQSPTALADFAYSPSSHERCVPVRRLRSLRFLFRLASAILVYFRRFLFAILRSRGRVACTLALATAVYFATTQVACSHLYSLTRSQTSTHLGCPPPPTVCTNHSPAYSACTCGFACSQHGTWHLRGPRACNLVACTATIPTCALYIPVLRASSSVCSYHNNKYKYECASIASAASSGGTYE